LFKEFERLNLEIQERLFRCLRYRQRLEEDWQ